MSFEIYPLPHGEMPEHHSAVVCSVCQALLGIARSPTVAHQFCGSEICDRYERVVLTGEEEISPQEKEELKKRIRMLRAQNAELLSRYYPSPNAGSRSSGTVFDFGKHQEETWQDNAHKNL